MLVEKDNIKLFKVRPGVTSSDYGITAAAHHFSSDQIAVAKRFRNVINSLQ